MKHASRSIERIVAAIQALDLDPIKVKLMDAEEGQGWSREYADRMELDYRRFLTLLVEFPEETIAPSKDVDKFWHGHILDTMKYAEDCERVFGYFLHHFPYFGMRGADDAASLLAAAANMNAIYEREFGEAASASAAWCVVASASAPAHAAWCVAAQPAALGTGSAWCVAARPSGKSNAAWCVAAKPSGTPAWCVAAKLAGASAWCVAASPNRVDVTVRPTLAPAS